MKQPSLFLSHGAPDFLISNDPALPFFEQLGVTSPEPKAIIIVSAHWIAEPVQVTTAQQYETIHDFGGFAAELYDLTYPAKGDPELATKIIGLLISHGVPATANSGRGLDHGAWIPLKAIYPDAHIPVVAVSLPGTLEACVELGSVLASLREEGVLIIGSGGSVHNLSAMNRSSRTDEWAQRFTYWLTDVVQSGSAERLLDSKKYPPEFRQAHPTVEHLAPLFVSLGAGESQPGKLIYEGYMYGNIGMACYQFD